MLANVAIVPKRTPSYPPSRRSWSRHLSTNPFHRGGSSAPRASSMQAGEHDPSPSIMASFGKTLSKQLVSSRLRCHPASMVLGRQSPLHREAGIWASDPMEWLLKRRKSAKKAKSFSGVPIEPLASSERLFFEKPAGASFPAQSSRHSGIVCILPQVDREIVFQHRPWSTSSILNHSLHLLQQLTYDLRVFGRQIVRFARVFLKMIELHWSLAGLSNLRPWPRFTPATRIGRQDQLPISGPNSERAVDRMVDH